MDRYSKEKYSESNYIVIQMGNSYSYWSREDKSWEEDKNTYVVFKEYLELLRWIALIKPFLTIQN